MLLDSSAMNLFFGEIGMFRMRLIRSLFLIAFCITTASTSFGIQKVQTSGMCPALELNTSSSGSNGLHYNRTFFVADISISPIQTGVTASALNVADNCGLTVAGEFFRWNVGLRALADFDPSPSGENILSTVGPADKSVYVSKFKPDGGYLWTKLAHLTASAPSTSSMLEVSAVTTDRRGNTIVSGKCGGYVSFFGHPAQLCSGAGKSLWIASLSGTGDLLWTQIVEGGYAGNPSLIGLEYNRTANELVALAQVNADVTIDNRIYRSALSPQGDNDLLFARFRPSDGTVVAAYRMGSQPINNNPVDDVPKDLFIGPDGSVYLAGAYGGTMDFDPGSGVAQSTALPTQYGALADSFLVKFSSQGGYQWHWNTDGPIASSDYSSAIAVSSNYVHVSGIYYGSIDFDPGSAADLKTLASNTPGEGDIYVTKLSQDNGSYNGTDTYGMACTPGDYCYADTVSEIVFGPNNDLLMLGYLFPPRQDFFQSLSTQTGDINFGPYFVPNYKDIRVGNFGEVVMIRRMVSCGLDYDFNPLPGDSQVDIKQCERTTQAGSNSAAVTVLVGR